MMNSSISNRQSKKSRTDSGFSRTQILTGPAAIAIILAAIWVVTQRQEKQPEMVSSAPILKAEQSVSNPVIQPLPKIAVNSVRSEPLPVSQSTPPKELLTAMIDLGQFRDGISEEQAEKFKQNVTNLIQQGAASVPTIQEFLSRNVDTDYGELKGGEQLGYSSLRASLFDALNQIGGPEAEAAMLQALQTTATPSEILELSKNLEQQSPGEYRDQILQAVHETLELSSANQLGNNVEVGPAFHILETFGNANAQNAEATDPVKANPQ